MLKKIRRARPTFAFFLLIFAFSSSVLTADPAPDLPESALPAVQTYDELLHAIREVQGASQRRIDRAINQEKVREAWETGKLIDTHVLNHKERAEYGEQVLLKLAKDLETSETELRFMLQFARTYPTHWPADELSWSHHQALLALNDPEERKAVADEAVLKGWNRDQVREEVRRRKGLAVSGESERIQVSKPGAAYTYRVVRAAEGPYQGQLALDLGFSTFFQPNKINKFKEGDIVRLIKGKLKRVELGEKAGPVRDVQISAGRTQAPGDEYLYAYQAYIRDIIDGDTFRARIDLGFKIITSQKLRLRGLDAPEIESADGREAKAFLEKQLVTNGAPVLIKTSKSDKYDRYLADVWVGETYINQLLVDNELAVRVSE